ncbi:MAG TPA: hypothetical protein VF916_07525 [Ktedonobacterales bacterium]
MGHQLSSARARVAAWYQRHLARMTLCSRTLAVATTAICAALLFAILSQAWVNDRLQQQVRQAQVENARLRADILATTRRAAWAEAPATIEDEARAIGYIRPGEQAVVIVSAAARPSGAASAPGASHGTTAGAQGSQSPGWWARIFGG